MTEYSIIKAVNNSVNNEFLGQERFYVCYADGPQAGLRKSIVGYETEAKAKRSIRDLKRKEENAGVHGHLVSPTTAIEPCTDSVPFVMPDNVADPFTGNGGGLSQPLPIIRQVGCYPYLKKSQYRR